jgi:hypothetical protein
MSLIVNALFVGGVFTTCILHQSICAGFTTMVFVG